MPAYLVDTCRHCRQRDQSMSVIGAATVRKSGLRRELIDKSSVFAGVMCNSCQEPAAVEIWHSISTDSGQTMAELSNAAKHNSDITSFGLTHAIVPTPVPSEMMPGLPESVEKALNQAETAFDLPDMEELAAIAYRRAIERAIEYKYKKLTGDLVARISKLAADHVIPQQMADWAHQVRIIGNNGAHDEGVDRQDVAAARGFADAFLRYLIVLPDQVAARRRETAPASEQGDEPKEPGTA